MNQNRFKLFILILGGWIVFGLFLTFDMYLFYPFAPGQFAVEHELVWELTLSFIWALSTPLIFMLSNRFPIEKKYLVPRMGLHLVASFALGILECLIHGFIIMAAWTPPEQWSMSRMLPSLFFNVDKMMMVYLVILFVHQMYLYSRKLTENELHASKLESRLMQAQLQALKTQIQPHFLFNTLNAMTTLLHKDPDAAERMIVRLGDLLRMTLENTGTQLIPLHEEIRFLQSYLEIEQIRFHDRLSVVLDIHPDTIDVPVPNLILQPLAENAIKHGFAQSSDHGTIEIISRLVDGTLHLTVRDNGAGIRFDRDQGVREGVGISNTRARLQQLYGSSFDFELTRSDNRGAVASISIPCTIEGKKLPESVVTS